MDKDRIVEQVGRLPEIPASKYPIEDDEIFEGNEYGAHFKFTRNFMQVPGIRITFNTLSISGTRDAKDKIIQDFIDALGEPPGGWMKVPGVEFVSWLISPQLPTT